MPKKPIIFCGIDPGVQGAYCLYTPNKILKLEKLPLLDNGRIDYEELKSQWIFNDYDRKVFCLIEKPWVQSRQGGGETIWRNFERVMIAAEAVFGEVQEVRPMEWQKGLGFCKGDPKTQSIKFATKEQPKQDFFRRTKVRKEKTGDIDDNQTDAYCISYYAFLLNQIQK
jgi:hypothetical protein